DMSGVSIVGVEVELGWFVRPTEARVVGRDGPIASLAHHGNYLPPEKRPSRLSVEKENRRSVSLVEVRQAQSVDLAEVRRELEVREPLECIVRRTHDRR